MSVLTLPDAKRHLAIDADTFNTDLEAMIASAEAALGQRVGPLAPTTITIRMAGGVRVLSLPTMPVISLTSITPYSGPALDISTLYLDLTTGQVSSNNLIPFVAYYYDVVYVAGRTTCPDDLLLAVRELVRHLWETRRGPAGPGAGAGGGAQRGPGSGVVPGLAYLLPPRVTELIAPHTQPVSG